MEPNTIPSVSDGLGISLVREIASIEEKLRRIDGEESQAAVVPQSAELGTRSWENDVATTRMTIKNELLNLLKNTRQTLGKIREGMYGKCELCGRQIEDGRLKIMPTARLCVRCTANRAMQ